MPLYFEYRQLRRIIRIENDRPTKIAHHFRGVFDGLRGHLGHTLELGHPDRPWELQPTPETGKRRRVRR